MGLKGLLDRNEEPSDVESEREALRRQRAEGAAELEALKRTLSERVAFVQQRERELAEAQARVDKREQKLVSADGPSVPAGLGAPPACGSEGNACRARCSCEPTRREAAVAAREQGRAHRRTHELPAAASGPQAPGVATDQLDVRESELAARANELDQRETALASALDEREAALEAGNDQGSRGPADATAELERIEEKLAELRDAEQAFARTHAELAKPQRRSRRAGGGTREARTSARREGSTPGRSRRARGSDSPPGAGWPEAGARAADVHAGLRGLQERGLRGGQTSDEPLH